MIQTAPLRESEKGVRFLSMKKSRKFSYVALGGTFDQLHKGHRILIARALEVGDRVLVGLTTDEMADRLAKRHEVASFNERRKSLEDFLRGVNAIKRVQILPLDDPYGPTLTRNDTEAIVVSKETAPRADEINMLRARRGLKLLEIVIVDMVLAEDLRPIYSTRIRMGEIDKDGRLI